MTRQPRLLFLAYYFPPVPCIASVRSWNLAKYLSKQGWQITVVTPDSRFWRSVDRPALVTQQLDQYGIQRLFTGHRLRFLNNAYLKNRGGRLGHFFARAFSRLARECWELDIEVGWNAAVTAATRHLRPGDFDVVLVTGKPYPAFEVAQRLASRLQCPYVLDYRDPWTASPAFRSKPGYPHARGRFKRETKVLADCAAVTIVSQSHALALDEAFGVGDKVHVLTNGFDPEEIAAIEPCKFGHFAIVYAGSVSLPLISLEPVMAALERLRTSSAGGLPDWRFHYYGTGSACPAGRVATPRRRARHRPRQRLQGESPGGGEGGQSGRRRRIRCGEGRPSRARHHHRQNL